jgi:hypothetical protein
LIRTYRPGILFRSVADVMGGSVEKKETDLKKNMAIVEKDKEKIEKTVAELDGYKRDALMKTWEKVNTYVYMTYILLGSCL